MILHVNTSFSLILMFLNEKKIRFSSGNGLGIVTDMNVGQVQTRQLSINFVSV